MSAGGSVAGDKLGRWAEEGGTPSKENYLCTRTASVTEVCGGKADQLWLWEHKGKGALLISWLSSGGPNKH